MIDEDKIIAFILDELDETERQEVAHAIAQDKQLQETADKYRTIKKGFRAKRVSHLAAQIAAYESSLPPISADNENSKNKESGKNKGRFGYTAILVFSILIIAMATFYGKTTYSNTTLAQKHFWMPADPAVAGQQDENNFTSAIDVFFARKDYKSAAALFAAIPGESPYAPAAQYYKAHANFLIKNYDKALIEFESLSKQKNDYSPNQQRRIEWNTMISRLAKGGNIDPIVSEWRESAQGKPLAKDLDSIWRKLLH